jgi:protein SCO1/2
MSASEARSAPIGGSFELVDHYGEAVSDQTYRGKYLLVFFGFTHCRSICPRTLTTLAAALADLGALVDLIAPLYVTVDPERDTPDVMRAYLGTYPPFVGLTGTRAQVDEIMQRFRVFARRAPDPADPTGYDMPHTAITYLIDPDGNYVAHFIQGVSASTIVTSLRRLIRPLLDKGPPS